MRDIEPMPSAFYDVMRKIQRGLTFFTILRHIAAIIYTIHKLIHT